MAPSIPLGMSDLLLANRDPGDVGFDFTIAMLSTVSY
jgi:hypothetical protein